MLALLSFQKARKSGVVSVTKQLWWFPLSSIGALCYTGDPAKVFMSFETCEVGLPEKKTAAFWRDRQNRIHLTPSGPFWLPTYLPCILFTFMLCCVRNLTFICWPHKSISNFSVPLCINRNRICPLYVPGKQPTCSFLGTDKQYTEHRSRVVSTPASYLRGPGLTSRLENELFWGFPWFSWVPP
jgi:hypothetical protein